VPSLSGEFQWLSVVFGAAGLVWGVAADRISTLWPDHEDGVTPRRIDWRTVVVALVGAAALASVPARFDDVGQRLVFGIFFVACVLLLATDLDQRLMPDVLTLPLIVIGALTIAWGGDSLILKSPVWLTVVAAIAVPLVLVVASIPFGAGAFGGGDVKFLIGAGLLTGPLRLVLSAFSASLLAGVAIAVLLVMRRITLKSYIPLGPFLIAGVLWVTLLPSAG
jgi:leader peptidase (prepilin peptidase)/N-methyltransferase